MKGRVKNIIMASFFATMLVFITGGLALAEYHHVDNCMVCHDIYGGGDCGDYTNLRLIYCDLSTPNSGIKTVKFTCDFSRKFPCDPEGTNSYADGDAIYDGVCEVCHTQTKYHRNDGSGEPHYAGQYCITCITCHPHSDEFSHAGGPSVSCESCHGHDAGYEYAPGQFSQGAETYQSHSTHTENDSDDLKGPNIACGACHDTNNFPYFLSGTDSNGSHKYELSETDVCDNCHSQGGAFDGVAMAQANWDAGIYETNGTTLKSGKEQWCASCHDDEPAYIGIYAPNVVGDNQTYGFYVTGHKVSCTNCHDASKNHIDDEHRTYELDEGNGNSVVNPYSDSYRLRGANTKPSQYLCYDCHNSVEILGQSSSDVSHTNFWHNDGDIVNSHWLHFVAQTGIQFDSDWDGTHDASPSCVACHNVHGSPTCRMIRHGELISSYGTTDKIPALNFAYLVAGSFATATWTPDIAQAGDYGVYAWWKASSNRATNAKYTVYYNGGSQSFEVNQEINGSQWNLLGTFSFAAGTSGYVELTNEGANEYVMADAVGWDGDSDGTPDVIIDNGDPGFDSAGDWTCTSGVSGAYGDDHCYHAKPAPEPDPDATLPESVGGRMSLLGSGVAQNGVCWACHSGMSYERAPYLGPKVLMGKAEPDPVPNDGSGSSLITVLILDHDDDPMDISVTIDLSPIGGDPNQAMTYDGNGIFSHQVTIPADTPDSPLSFVITATDGDMNTGKGKAALTVIDPDSIYVDNPDAEFVCDWDTTATGGYGDDYRWHAAGDGSCTATWTPVVTQAGSYEVYAWWKASTSRATNSPYTIYYDGGPDTVQVNQEINGSQWVLLGTYPFAAGTSGYVVLSDDANEYVIADAIKLKPQP